VNLYLLSPPYAHGGLAWEGVRGRESGVFDGYFPLPLRTRTVDSHVRLRETGVAFAPGQPGGTRLARHGDAEMNTSGTPIRMHEPFGTSPPGGRTASSRMLRHPARIRADPLTDAQTDQLLPDLENGD
jgi:hypothetical protein